MPHTFLMASSPVGTYVIALGLKEVELQGDAVLGGGHQLPDAVFVGGVLLGPARAGDGAIELGEESATGSWREREEASPAWRPAPGRGRICGLVHYGGQGDLWTPAALGLVSGLSGWEEEEVRGYLQSMRSWGAIVGPILFSL